MKENNDIFTRLSLLSAQYHVNEQDYQDGLITQTYYTETLDQIKTTLYTIISNIKS